VRALAGSPRTVRACLVMDEPQSNSVHDRFFLLWQRAGNTASARGVAHHTRRGTARHTDLVDVGAVALQVHGLQALLQRV
jgi:hypothetical protein